MLRTTDNDGCPSFSGCSSHWRVAIWLVFIIQVTISLIMLNYFGHIAEGCNKCVFGNIGLAFSSKRLPCTNQKVSYQLAGGIGTKFI
jgi:hypothetical protein